MPESSVRKEAVAKKQKKQHDALIVARREREEAETTVGERPTSRTRSTGASAATTGGKVRRTDRPTVGDDLDGTRGGARVAKTRAGVSPASRRWVPPVFITLGLLGVAWMVVYYVAGAYIPPMLRLGNWNIAIGMGLMAAAFAVSTLWK